MYILVFSILNSLPADIIQCDTKRGFKRHLKTFLSNNCYPVHLIDTFSSASAAQV